MVQNVNKNILGNTIIPHTEENMLLAWRFKHNNAPKHTSPVVKSYLEEIIQTY